jgi:hypothetical protein
MNSSLVGPRWVLLNVQRSSIAKPELDAQANLNVTANKIMTYHLNKSQELGLVTPLVIGTII